MITELLEKLRTRLKRAGETEGLIGPENREAFSGWPMIIGWLAMLIFTFHATTHMVAAGDTWVAMACGRHFVKHGVDTVEPFSANSHKPGPTAEEVQTWPGWAQWITDKVGLETVKRWHPTGWVNQNWLTHVMFYWLTTTLGSEAQPYFDALVLWKLAIYALAALCLYYTMRIYGVNPALAAVLVCFAMFIGRSFFDVRPAGFSNLLVAAYVLVLALASHKNGLYAWLLVPLVVFWGNVHGGYVYAFIMLAPFVVWHVIMNLPRRWTIAAYGILTWLVLYAMANRFLHREHLTPIAVSHDWAFYLLLLAVVGSILLARHRQVSDGGLVAYHAGTSCILFLLLLTRFFVAMPLNLGVREGEMLKAYFTSSRVAYVGIFAFAMILGAVVVSLKEKVVRVMAPRAVLHTVAAGAAAFVAMVLFNPFHLTNLTHTFVISLSKHAERWRNVHEWNPAFDWDNAVGTAVPFLVMYILAWLVFATWTVVLVRMSGAAKQPARKRVKVVEDNAKWPKIDLGLLVIAAMTIYMAIRSRRFIPVAAFAACPIIALLLDQAIRALATSNRSNKPEAPAMPAQWRSTFIVAGAGAVLCFGTWWGLKFKRVYLDYWPADRKLTSVFMRMTASDAKPFYACQFMRENKLSGNMFNYWTEGGFIAWGQEPDPNSGRTPLQLFMDGRAQAAYNVPAFDLWTHIISAEPIVRRAVAVNRKLTMADYVEIGKWVGEKLRNYNVWVVMMPAGEFNKPFTNGLQYNADWRMVFLNDKQRLFVDVRTARGMELYQGMFTRQTRYPDDCSANLALGHNLLLFQDAAQKRKGLDLVVKAYNQYPSPAPVLEMLLIAAQFGELLPYVDSFCEQCAEDFEKNQASYANQDGYDLRLEAARLALIRLEQAALARGDATLAAAYARRREMYENERSRIAMRKRW